MIDTSWLRQVADKPLFEKMLWSRPENRQFAGKLLIIGGSSHGFAAPGAAYSAALAAGAGTVRVVLPESTRKTLGKAFLEADFAPSTPSGSFSRQAVAPLLEAVGWADSVLLTGDFGRNSETAIVLDSLAAKYKGQLTAAQDAIDYFLDASSPLLARETTLFVINLGKLQKLAKNNRPTTPVLHSMTLHELVTVLADWTSSVPASFITKHSDHLIAAHDGKVSTTKDEQERDWQVWLAAYASVWWLQQPKQPLEAMTTAIYEFLNKSAA